MELHENRTELERLLADVWDYEDAGPRKTSLPKWLFAFTLAGAILWTSSPSNVVAPATTTLAPPEMTQVDQASSENLDEDLDYRVAGQAQSLAGWRAFLEAHPDGPHAQAARAEIRRLLPTSPQPVETADQSKPSPATSTPIEVAQSPAPPAPPVTVENKPALSTRTVEVAEQPLPSLAATQTPGEAAQSPPPPAAPVAADNEPAPSPQPVEAADQSPSSPAATHTSDEAAQPPAAPAPPVGAENDSSPSPIPAAAPDEVAPSAPAPRTRPHEVAAARSEEPTRHRHWRVEHRHAGQPNLFTILVTQLFHHRH